MLIDTFKDKSKKQREHFEKFLEKISDLSSFDINGLSIDSKIPFLPEINPGRNNDRNRKLSIQYKNDAPFPVYFDKKAKFITRLIQFDEKEKFNVLVWMRDLYEATFSNGKYAPSSNPIRKPRYPCVIVIHKSLLQKMFEYYSSDKKMQELLTRHNKNLEQHMQQQCSFFNNSSIWIRLVDWKKSEIDKAVEELEYFRSIGLYDYGSAKENLEYNIRLQKQNYLDSTTQGHGVYVTPQLYGDETEHWKILYEENKCDK